MISSSPSISLNTLMTLVPQSEEAQTQYMQLSRFGPDSKCPPATSVLALHIIHDLYNEFSSDEANLNRIITNLQLAADDLLMLSARMRDLKH